MSGFTKGLFIPRCKNMRVEWRSRLAETLKTSNCNINSYRNIGIKNSFQI